MAVDKETQDVGAGPMKLDIAKAARRCGEMRDALGVKGGALDFMHEHTAMVMLLCELTVYARVTESDLLEITRSMFRVVDATHKILGEAEAAKKGGDDG